MRRRVWLFAALCAACVIAAGTYLGLTAASQSRAPRAPAPPAAAARIVAQPHLYYLSSGDGGQSGLVTVAAIDDPEHDRYETPLRCQRMYVAEGTGLCLGTDQGTLGASRGAYAFDSSFRVGASYQVSGIPSRVRLSRDASRGAMTVFVTGDGYTNAFSTRTTIVGVTRKEPALPLEQLAVTKDGRPFKAADFNFWGVTFAAGGDRFYATLATGGTTYLITGTVSSRKAQVLTENVECPSLSPDGSRIVYKKRVAFGNSGWRLYVLDLATMTERPLASETRSVDDQVEWLDGGHVLYSVPVPGTGLGAQTTLGVDIWEASVDGAEPARLLVHDAFSPSVARPLS